MLKKALKWLDEYFEISICVLLMSAMTLLIFVQVIMRYVFSNSLSWSEELARYMFIWLIYLGVSYAAKQMKHVRIEAALLMFPGKLRPYITILGEIILFAFAIFIVYKGVGMVKFQRILKSAAMGIPMSYIYAAPVVGFALTVVRQVQTIIYHVRTLGRNDDAEATP